MAAMVVCGAIFPFPTFAQKKASSAPAPKPAKPPKPVQPPKPSPEAAAAARRLQDNPAKELDRFTAMTPEQREKELSKLPPPRRAAFEQRLARYQQMTPDQQDRFKRQLEIMQRLSPVRQNAVKDKIQELLALPRPELRKALTREELKGFSPDEQTLIRDRFPFISKNLD